MEWVILGGVALFALLANRPKPAKKTQVLPPPGPTNLNDLPEVNDPNFWKRKESEAEQKVLDVTTGTIVGLGSTLGALGVSGAGTVAAGALIGAIGGHYFAQLTEDTVISGIQDQTSSNTVAGELALKQGYDI